MFANLELQYIFYIKNNHRVHKDSCLNVLTVCKVPRKIIEQDCWQYCSTKILLPIKALFKKKRVCYNIARNKARFYFTCTARFQQIFSRKCHCGQQHNYLQLVQQGVIGTQCISAAKPRVILSIFDFYAACLTLLWYHGVNITPGLFDTLNIPNDKIVSITLPFYFFHRFLLTISIYATFNSTLLSL